jgi:hypothetical protein
MVQIDSICLMLRKSKTKPNSDPVRNVSSPENRCNSTAHAFNKSFVKVVFYNLST